MHQIGKSTPVVGKISLWRIRLGALWQIDYRAWSTIKQQSQLVAERI
jgi:hypothetical protein